MDDAWKKSRLPPIHNVSNKRVFLLGLFLANQTVHLFYVLFWFVFTPNKSRPNTNTFPMAVKDKLHKLLSCLIFTSQLLILVIFLHISTHIVLKRICAFVLTIYYKNVLFTIVLLLLIYVISNTLHFLRLRKF